MLAAGYRYNASGALTSVGAGGWCWQSSSYAADNCNAGQYGFRESYVNPLNDANRADAVSVRCVQHLRELPFISAVLPCRKSSGPGGR